MILQYLPPSVIRALPELALIAIGFVVEWHYVSRITVFTNSMALATHTASLSDPSALFTAYVEFGIVLGLYGFIQYIREESIGQPYYVTAYYLYSSMTVGLIIFLPVGAFAAVVLATVAHIGMAVWRGGVSSWVYSGPRPFEVTYFINQNSIRYPDHEIGRWVSVPLTEVFDR
ncbi:hypothetical protein M0R89_11655 [Halorussus limi]|uniref:Uncharacterized protein n=1 Tax=Halorussus limi TaxID=2938695 RepID=A0A8U0HR42_9EURY|nr:hypothetical protein [Halorussus limi]UPV73203.1 hypothetical protein M0R89_11655 [Halorussus limi]